MTKPKLVKWEETVKDGLRSANKGNPFWSKSDAMSSLNQFRSLKYTLSGRV